MLSTYRGPGSHKAGGYDADLQTCVGGGGAGNVAQRSSGSSGSEGVQAETVCHVRFCCVSGRLQVSR
jgi:hypothetical protein